MTGGATYLFVYTADIHADISGLVWPIRLKFCMFIHLRKVFDFCERWRHLPLRFRYRHSCLYLRNDLTDQPEILNIYRSNIELDHDQNWWRHLQPFMHSIHLFVCLRIKSCISLQWYDLLVWTLACIYILDRFFVMLAGGATHLTISPYHVLYIYSSLHPYHWFWRIHISRLSTTRILVSVSSWPKT